jgi:hypothetical protein
VLGHRSTFDKVVTEPDMPDRNFDGRSGCVRHWSFRYQWPLWRMLSEYNRSNGAPDSLSRGPIVVL